MTVVWSPLGAQRALEAVGGWLAVKSRTPFTEPKLRAEFCAAYTEAA